MESDRDEGTAKEDRMYVIDNLVEGRADDEGNGLFKV